MSATMLFANQHTALGLTVSRLAVALAILFGMSLYALCGEMRVSIEPCRIPCSIEAKVPGQTTTVQMPVDFYVIIRNTSKEALRFYEDSNSWGYERLKLVCDNEWHEYWIAKRPVAWYRNFESFVTLGPQESYRIPVVFSAAIWDLAGVKKDKKAVYIRAVFDQPVWTNAVLSVTTNRLWFGIESSPYYHITNVIPRQTASGTWRSEDEP